MVKIKPTYYICFRLHSNIYIEIMMPYHVFFYINVVDVLGGVPDGAYYDVCLILTKWDRFQGLLKNCFIFHQTFGWHSVLHCWILLLNKGLWTCLNYWTRPTVDGTMSLKPTVLQWQDMEVALSDWLANPLLDLSQNQATNLFFLKTMTTTKKMGPV